ncbi:MAG: radical SAM protein [bacterium]
MKVCEIKAKSVLTKSGLPGADFVVNPYVGCSFGCQYCYAAFIGRWKHPGEDWGSFVDVKVNASEVLKKQLLKLEKQKLAKDFGTVFFSSVTDPYLGLEAKYQITRKCLESLVDFEYQGEVSILTKSPLVTRDIDIFKKLKRVSVGLTITSLDDKVSQFLEGKAPPVSSRLKALKELNANSIDTYAFVGPILPYFVAQEEKLDKLFQAIKEAGTSEIWCEHINLSPKIKIRLFNYLKSNKPELIAKFEEANTREYQTKLEAVVRELAKKHKLNLVGNKVIFHGRFR